MMTSALVLALGFSAGCLTAIVVYPRQRRLLSTWLRMGRRLDIVLIRIAREALSRASGQ